jgi:membrane associated rhomboid family serine protease
VDCVQDSVRSTPRWRNVAGAGRVGRPVVVPALIGINVLVFALTVVAAGSLNRNDASALFQYGSLVPGLVADGEWWRLITSGFLHYGPIHLAFNAFALYVIGREVEGVLGRARLITVYAVSLLGGSAAVMLFSDPASQTAGASGAVFGVMASLAVLALRLRVPAGQAFGLIALNIVISIVVPGISLVGHLGGLVAGAATTAALVYTPARNGPGLQIAAVSGVVVVLLALIGVSVV